jgi:arabinose-5-phosphate isomerase
MKEELENKIKRIIRYEAKAILNIPITDDYLKAIELIFEHVHNRKGKLVASGMGKAGQIALNIATTFSSTGTPAVFLHPSDAQHGDLGVIQPNDVLLLVSNSGKTIEIVQLLDLVERLFEGVHIPKIVISGNPKSILAQNADAFLYTGGPKEVCPLGLTPTTSTTTMTVIGDILVSLMIERIGFTPEEYAKRHHAGYLGRKSRAIQRINNNGSHSVPKQNDG